MAIRSVFQGGSVKRSIDIAVFEKRLGYEFQNLEILLQSLTHPSIASQTRPDNQRLEFLGDRVLGLVMAEVLLELDTRAAEGTLAPRFNALVRKETCADVAREIDLGAVLKLGRSEMKSGGRRKETLLGDAMEAVIAAIYIDAGFGVAKKTVLSLWGDRVHRVKSDARDAKTMLQEWAQARSLPPPQYNVVSRSGPDHAPVFEIQAVLITGETETATANNKRKAEQAAAKALLNKLDI
jgi:ribonuclease-3